MIPPVDDRILRNNPRFEKLYNTITTSILNPDGSTKIDPSAQQRDAVRQELKAYRLKAARVKLICTALSTAIPTQTAKSTNDEQQQQQSRKDQQRRLKPRSQPPSQSQTQTLPLPPDLLELLILLPPFLNNASTLSSSSLSLLLSNPPFTDLPTLFPRILELVSSRLVAQAKTLARVLSPNTNPSYIHRAIPSLPSISNTLVSDLAATKTALSRARIATTASLTRYLAKHTEALTLLLAALESKHGPLARSSELHAEEARQQAQSWALAAETLLWETRFLAYPPEARGALVNYRQHLRDAGRRLEDTSRTREDELADYGVDIEKRAKRESGIGNKVQKRHRRRTTVDESKERTMREMARVWREMETRLREIQGDLNRLR
ncbi:hypothetical protein FHL15_008088 [Xylaria flabelliformis]|uniref:Uncharacterized protein n=1 Tax=Xylaria flabelliformis TaxID=2512241 RepID=A0A553HT16_9PEZI|nr:hypothetical protein FHL15_008088 [Xylaria flabelliformis]